MANHLWEAEQVYFYENGTYTQYIDQLDINLPENCQPRKNIAAHRLFCGDREFTIADAGGWRVTVTQPGVHYYAMLNNKNTWNCMVLNQKGKYICDEAKKNKQN